MIEVSVVGCGTIGRAHALAWSEIKEVKLGYLIDLNINRVKKLSSEVNAIALSDISDIPNSTKIVSVATPPSSHFSIVKKLLSMNKHVFCEKPLTTTYKEGRILEKIALQKGLKLGVGFKMRYEPIFIKAKQLIGKLGRIYQVQTHKIQSIHNKPWLSETGAMLELSVHDFDLVHFILNVKPRKIKSVLFSKRLGWEKPDGFQIEILYEKGIMGSLCGLYTENITWTGRDFSMWIAGENGYLQVDRFDRIVLHTKKIEEFKFDINHRPNTFILELKEFLDCVIHNKKEPITPEDANLTTWIVCESERMADDRNIIY